MSMSIPAVSSALKNYSSSQNSFISKFVTIPLAQEYGRSYRALVKAGDRVQEGDRIAVCNTGGHSTYIHASVPGEVTEICSCILQNGRQEFAIRIKFGGSFKYLGKIAEEASADSLSPLSVTESLFDKGVVNTFTSSHPESLGLQIRMIKSCRCIVVRMFDEDPYCMTDSLVAKFYFERIVSAAKVIARTLNAGMILLAIDQKMQDKPLARSFESDTVRLLEMNISRYPCGTPGEMIAALAKSGPKKSQDITLCAQDLFIDASSMLEVYNAVLLDTPAISRNVHFSGNCLWSSCILNVKVGTPIKDIVAQLGGFSKPPALVIVNGELCGSSAQNLEQPVTKDIKSVRFVSSRKFTDEQIYSCVSCGHCRHICPARISPDLIYSAVLGETALDETLEKSVMICSSCGLCSTVCQARLPLSHTITVLRENIQSNSAQWSIQD